ncbi:LPD3 domain-containing protein [Magnetospirillum molischianum]
MPVVSVPRVAIENSVAERRTAKAAREGHAPTDLENSDLPGMQIHLSAGDWKHAVASWGKSVTEIGEDGAALAHLDAVRLLPELFQKAARIESHADRKGDPNVAQVHRFFAAMEHGGNRYAVKMTVEEHPAGRQVLVIDGIERLEKLHDMHLAKKLPAEGTREEPVQALRSDQQTTTPFPERVGPVIDIGNTIILRDLIRGIKGEDGKVYLQAGSDGLRGSVTLGDGQTVIRLMQAADASTFLHESGHVWLDMVRKLAEAERAPTEARAVWQDIRGHLGAADGEALTAAHHETFARWFEAYLRDGKAPSAALAGVFERFKTWLVALYADLRTLGGEVPEGVRGVFDRLLATDRELAARASNDPGNVNTPPHGGSVGAAASRDTTLDQETLKGALGVENAPIIRGQDPLLRAAHSPSVETRRIMQDLADHPLMFAKNAEGIASPVAVETRLKTWDGPLARAVTTLDDAFIQYRLGRAAKTGDMLKIGMGDTFGRRPEGMLDAKAFREEVGRAMRRNDQHEIPEVAEAARRMRVEVFDPLKNEAIAAGLLPPDVTVDTALSYLTRVYDIPRIVAHRPEFEGRLTGWLRSLKAEAGQRMRDHEAAMAEHRATLDRLDVEDANHQAELSLAEQALTESRHRVIATERDTIAARRVSRQAESEAAQTRERMAQFRPSDDLAKGDPLADLLRDLRRGRPKEPLRLLGWVRRQGGLREDGGEVRAIGANGLLNDKTGISLDEAALRAWEAGFLPGAERPSVNDFLRALADDANNHVPVYREADLERVAYRDYLAETAAEFDRMGIDLTRMSDAEIKARIAAAETGGDVAFREASPAAKAKAREIGYYQRRAEAKAAKATERAVTADAAHASARTTLDAGRREVAALKARAEAIAKDLSKARTDLDRATKGREAAKGLAGSEEIELADIAREITDQLLGMSASRTAYEPIPLTRGPLRERTLSIPDAMIEDFLESDINVVARIYARTMAADVELAKRFGRADLRDQLDAVRSDYARLRVGVEDGKRLAALHDRERRDLADIEAVRDRLRGTYALPRDPQGLAVRTFRVVRNLNYLRLLGGMTLAAVSDTGRPVMVHGMTRVVGDGLAPLVRNVRGFRLAAEEAKLAGTALDLVLNTRMMKMADVFDDYGRLSKFERGIQVLSDNFGLVSLMAPWNAAWKQFTGVITQTRMLQAIDQWRDLPSGHPERERLAWLGIDRNAAERIATQFRAHGKQQDGLWWANTQAWTDPEAVSAFRAAMVKDIDRTIVTPGQDKPLWMSTELGKVIGQFKTFNMVSTQRTALAALQQRDAAVLNGVMMMTTFGTLSYALASAAAGREMSDDPAHWLAEGFDRSGLLFWLSDVAGTGGKVLGIGTTSRYGSRSAWEAALGPSAGLASDLSQVLGEAGRGDWKATDTHALRRMMPYQNLFYLRQMFDAAESGINDAFGVPPTPKKVAAR